jgi:hypothetical protein
LLNNSWTNHPMYTSALHVSAFVKGMVSQSMMGVPDNKSFHHIGSSCSKNYLRTWQLFTSF